jgi:hypothetical protein
VDLAQNLKKEFTVTTPLELSTKADKMDTMQGLEDTTEEELMAAFDELENEMAMAGAPPSESLKEQEIAVDAVYSFAELEQVDKGVVPTAFEDDIHPVADSCDSVDWDVEAMLKTKGLSS